MMFTPKYPLLKPLEKITRHDQLPDGAVVIAELREGPTDYDPCYLFVKRGNQLSILLTYIMRLKTGELYTCDQYDFPLKALSWFPRALEDFRKPPAEGGLHAGALISKDQDVDGEMLAVGSTTQGYNITNWSRDADGVDADPDYYDPTEFDLDYDLLYDHGLLELWTSLGEQYEQGVFDD
ncbi:MAG: hypothetical protein CSA49_06565 [Gammaproteobacteria bacterium]|nr:MAG: hypothetical protein CSA49_06565 [Gammaproteobacteria bacterium]